MTGRLMIKGQGGLAKECRPGEAPISSMLPTLISADAADSLLVAKFSAGRTLTADTAANYLAAFPQLDIGESIECVVGVSTAFALTLVTAAGVTLKGRATVPASTTCRIFITKTSATTVDLTVV
mgnify:CR=1 FL=1